MPDKYIKEIDDILKKASAVARKGHDYRKPSKPSLKLTNSFHSWKVGFKFPSISPGRLMVAGLVVFFFGLILNLITNGAVTLIVWSGIILFLTAYIWYIFRPRTGTTLKYEKKWRGRSIEDDTPSSLFDKFNHWFKIR